MTHLPPPHLAELCSQRTSVRGLSLRSATIRALMSLMLQLRAMRLRPDSMALARCRSRSFMSTTWIPIRSTMARALYLSSSRHSISILVTCLWGEGRGGGAGVRTRQHSTCMD